MGSPNAALARLITESQASHKALARRVNQLAEQAGQPTAYTHTSVANWVAHGMVPRRPAPQLLAVALGERLGRPVTVADIGLGNAAMIEDHVGLRFPRALPAAIDSAAGFWSHMDRRRFLAATASTAFTATAFSGPVLRWATRPRDDSAAHAGTRRIGPGDIAQLNDVAEHARHADSRYGGGSPGASMVARCLRDVAAPMVRGSYTDATGRELFTSVGLLARLAGWTAFDEGRHSLAQRHYIQALRMARAAGDVALGGYVLSCMALQASLRGFHDDALDMLEAALERTRHTAPPRVRAFLHLIEARAWARAQRPGAAAHALARSETLLERADNQSGDDPEWIDFYTFARLSADAVEIHRDLGQPRSALRWAERNPPPNDAFARSHGLRLAVTASVHLQQRDLDAGLACAHTSIDILTGIASQRALDYLHQLTGQLDPWRDEDRVKELTHRLTTGLAPVLP